MPLPTTIATWPSHTARAAGREAQSALEGAPSLVYCVAKSFGGVGLTHGYRSVSYSSKPLANICYSLALAVLFAPRRVA